MDKKNDFPYYNRELSWMDFNDRVLDEALDKKNPIMERLRFLGITASNLDEFFMVRVAGVKAQIHSGYRAADLSGLTPSELLVKLTEKIRDFTEKQYSGLHRSILPALKKDRIRFLTPEEMNDRQKKYISDYFERVLFPVLTPLAVDRSRPFPILSNKSLNLAVRLKNGDETCFALVQVPSILSRFLEVPSETSKVFILLENIIMYKINDLFGLYGIEACLPFRLTRNADLEIDEDADGGGKIHQKAQARPPRPAGDPSEMRPRDKGFSHRDAPSEGRGHLRGSGADRSDVLYEIRLAPRV